ncbi:iron(III) transport system substrate-binding protein [Oxalobacteraceae bacterium GrIS 1.11]
MPTASLTDYLLAGVDADMVIGWVDTAAKTPGIAQLVAPGIEAGADGWCRPTGFSVAFVADPTGLAKRACALSAAWSDLADPALKDGIVFPDPRRSGAGWELLHAIARNVIDYPASAREPAARVGGGDAVLGGTVRIAATRRLGENPALAMALPLDAIGAEAEVYGVLKTSGKPVAAARVLAWLASAATPPHVQRHAKLDLGAARPEPLFEIDAARAAAERAELLQRFAQLLGVRAKRAASVA